MLRDRPLPPAAVTATVAAGQPPGGTGAPPASARSVRPGSPSASSRRGAAWRGRRRGPRQFAGERIYMPAVTGRPASVGNDAPGPVAKGGVAPAKRRTSVDAERGRLEEARTKGVAWRKWGPYLSERQWGTVREDYSQSGDAWNYFSHDQ